jgi:hypothetical protein
MIMIFPSFVFVSCRFSTAIKTSTFLVLYQETISEMARALTIRVLYIEVRRGVHKAVEDGCKLPNLQAGHP